MASKSAWQTLEDEVRAVAQTIWGVNFASAVVHGRQIDAYADLDQARSVAIEVTTEKTIAKVQEDLNKLIHVRNANFSQNHKMTECFHVTSFVPTPAMVNVCTSQNISVVSFEQFRRKFLHFDDYKSARMALPFGSAVDPTTGKKDLREYVLVQFAGEDGTDFGNIRDIYAAVQAGKQMVLIGEYGTGKSKSFEKLFELLAADAWNGFQFPIAIDLRKCWGLKGKYEIIRRHLDDLGMSEHANSFIKAYNDGFLVLLIDGFDELAVQAWSDDSTALRTLRAEALVGVRELIANQSAGAIICGRDHYFDSHEELISALGLANKNPLLIQSKEEFSYEEISDFFKRADYNIDIPEWLPRKPLTCEFFMELVRSDELKNAETLLDAIQFWDMYLDAVCSRESKIHPSFDPDTIKRILIAVSSITRLKPDIVEPITLREIQHSFESVVGYSPIEQAGVLLQRLPGLGRTAADTEDRRFTDTYLLDGLRSLHVVSIVMHHDPTSTGVEWFNPLSENALMITSRKLQTLNLTDDAIGYCREHCRKRNETLIFDLVCCSILAKQSDIDFGGVEIDGGYGSVLDVSAARVSGLYIASSILDKIILSGIESPGLTIKDCDIGLAQGVSNEQGIPAYLRGNKIQAFTSVATVSRIKNSDISAPHKVLVTILRKTYFQHGAARKEEALLRGLGNLVKAGTQDRIVNKLINEGLLTKAKGEEGWIYAPVRTHTRRVGKMLSELGLSRDAIWQYVAGITAF